MTNFDHDSDFQKCKHEISDLLQKGITAAEAPRNMFCPLKDLENYFKDERYNHLDRLLHRLYTISGRPDSSNILNGHLKAFATLLMIGQAEYISLPETW